MRSAGGDGPELRTGRRGLCLTGGGVTGALHQVGVLAALEEAERVSGAEGGGGRASRPPAAAFDVIVGASSGATVALALATGVGAGRLYRALLDPADDFFPLRRQHLFRLDAAEWGRVARSVLGALRRMLVSVSDRPLDVDPWLELERFVDALPAGLFTLNAYTEFLEHFCERRGLPRTFRGLDVELLVVAHDLDRGTRIVFGQEPLRDVSLALAVAASTAVPILFAPVRVAGHDCIDGGLGDVGHVDVAVERGCDRVLVVNPMVPFFNDPDVQDVPTGHGPRRRLRDKGLLWVYNQSVRLRSEGRFHRMLAAYRAAHPNVRVALVEPARDDAMLFLHSPMNFAARRTLLEHAYRDTLERLRSGRLEVP
ncbi:MAG: patatin-like phospholipase family protein [Myxococcota bacterium]|nr:patatin-like phospholipase family protein [Myxococcota bacterium]MDW8362143.1 patatin-like phospholipase family protein [Myxococcales bacterium]